MKRALLISAIIVIGIGVLLFSKFLAAVNENDQNKIAVTGSIEFCVKPLTEGTNLDAHAVEQGLKKLPEDKAEPFKTHKYPENIYVLYPAQVMLRTTSASLCSVMIRSLNPIKFEILMRSFYESQLKYEKVKSVIESKTSDTVTFTYHSPKPNNITVMVSYNKTEIPNKNLQGLITVARVRNNAEM